MHTYYTKVLTLYYIDICIQNLVWFLKRDCLTLAVFPGFLSLKKAWCSTALFHRCLQLRSLFNLHTIMVLTLDGNSKHVSHA